MLIILNDNRYEIIDDDMFCMNIKSIPSYRLVDNILQKFTTIEFDRIIQVVRHLCCGHFKGVATLKAGGYILNFSVDRLGKKNLIDRDIRLQVAINGSNRIFICTIKEARELIARLNNYIHCDPNEWKKKGELWDLLEDWVIESDWRVYTQGECFGKGMHTWGKEYRN